MRSLIVIYRSLFANRIGVPSADTAILRIASTAPDRPRGRPRLPVQARDPPSAMAGAGDYGESSPKGTCRASRRVSCRPCHCGWWAGGPSAGWHTGPRLRPQPRHRVPVYLGCLAQHQGRGPDEGLLRRAGAGSRADCLRAADRGGAPDRRAPGHRPDHRAGKRASDRPGRSGRPRRRRAAEPQGQCARLGPQQRGVGHHLRHRHHHHPRRHGAEPGADTGQCRSARRSDRIRRAEPGAGLPGRHFHAAGGSVRRR